MSAFILFGSLDVKGTCRIEDLGIRVHVYDGRLRFGAIRPSTHGVPIDLLRRSAGT